MLRIIAKNMVIEVNYCPYCGLNTLSDMGTDKIGYALIVCYTCHEKFFLLTGQRRTDKWWRKWLNKITTASRQEFPK